DRTRALTLEARARRRSDPTPRLSALHRDVFWTRPSILLSFFPGPGSNGCSWGRPRSGLRPHAGGQRSAPLVARRDYDPFGSDASAGPLSLIPAPTVPKNNLSH